MTARYDVVVVGCGGIGCATLYWTSRRGAGRVLGLEQFALGHHRGASQDHSRMIRKAYTSRAYTGLIGDAYRAWDAVERDGGVPLLVRTGALDLARRGTPGEERLVATVTAMRADDIACTELDAAEVRRRWPQFRLPDDARGVHQADGGLIDAARANAVHVALARARGAEVREHAEVRALEPTGDGVEVVTDRGRLRAGTVVLAAGAWTGEHLSRLGVSWPLTVTLEQVTYFATPHLRDFLPSVFPAWSWFGDHVLYGLPIHGEVATKAAIDLGGPAVTARTRTFQPDRARVDVVADFLRAHVPGALGPELYTKTCLYTLPPDRDFVIGALPGIPRVLVAVGAGHAFKFASLLGRILADLAVDGATPHDLSAFDPGRPALGSEAVDGSSRR